LGTLWGVLVGLFEELRVGSLRVRGLLGGILRILLSGLLVLFLRGMEDGASMLLVGELDDSFRRSLISSPSVAKSFVLD